jgi:hypothetical protein
MSADILTARKAKHYCRNPRCRSRLPEPVENEHRAFCALGCFEGFYRSRCRVCERDISTNPLTGERRRASARRQTCGRKCKAEHRKFPHVYSWDDRICSLCAQRVPKRQ